MRSQIVMSAATRLRRYGNFEDWMMSDNIILLELLRGIDDESEITDAMRACKIAASTIEQLQAEVERLKPISVKDQLPKPKQRVNVITNWDGFLPFFYINEEGDWVSETYQWRGQVTHWMPIPEAKEQAND